MTSSYDVVVLGGGPAGTGVATALTCRGRTVALFEPSNFDHPRPGETLGAEVPPLLDGLGLGEHGALPLVPFRGVRSAWGGPELVARASITHPLGDGWHVDRACFDQMLAMSAEKAGVFVQLHCGRCAVEPTPHGFVVHPARGKAALGRFLIDASGRGAPASSAALGESKWLQFDRLVALLGRIALPAPSVVEPELLLEAEEDGWWYSAPQPDGTLLVALMTDSDLSIAHGRADLTKRWQAALARTVHTSVRASNGQLLGPIRSVRADTGLLLPDRGRFWRAVGDAAMGCDPLTGNGVARALRSADAAAAEIDRALDGEDPVPTDPSAAFSDYLDRRARYYQMEGRWPAAPFWARRRSPNWTQAPLTLNPTTVLHWDGTQPNPADLACVESLLPYRVIRELLETLRSPRPAHEALRTLRHHAPLGDRRLLTALQLLVAHASIGS